MTRNGFLRALVGVPFAAGWVKKLMADGKHEVEVLEPVADHDVMTTDTTDRVSWTNATVTASNYDGWVCYKVVDGEWVQSTYTI